MFDLLIPVSGLSCSLLILLGTIHGTLSTLLSLLALLGLLVLFTVLSNCLLANGCSTLSVPWLSGLVLQRKGDSPVHVSPIRPSMLGWGEDTYTGRGE